LDICTVKPFVVGVGVPNVGVRAAPVMEVPISSPDPSGKPDLIVRTVTVDDVPGGKLETVTRPELSIDDMAFAVADVVHE
jgi:hypothetical protein